MKFEVTFLSQKDNPDVAILTKIYQIATPLGTSSTLRTDNNYSTPSHVTKTTGEFRCLKTSGTFVVQNLSDV